MISNNAQSQRDNSSHFLHLYWFCVVSFFTSVYCIMYLIYVPYPPEHRDMANGMIGFFATGIAASVIGFLLTGTPPANSKKPVEPGTATVDLSASITQVEEKK